MPPTPDLDRRIATARDDLACVTKAISELWEHLYAPDIDHRKDWEKEERKGAAPGWHAHWTGPHQVQQAYVAVVAELARAHWALGRRTEIPAHWTYPPDTSDRARTVPHSEAKAWAIVLAAMLRWLEAQDLDEAEQKAVREACDHIAKARDRVHALWPSTLPRRRCEHCGLARVITWGRWCEWCRRVHVEGSCAVCGAVAG